jgi:hypothetical protein
MFEEESAAQSRARSATRADDAGARDAETARPALVPAAARKKVSLRRYSKHTQFTPVQKSEQPPPPPGLAFHCVRTTALLRSKLVVHTRLTTVASGAAGAASPAVRWTRSLRTEAMMIPRRCC